MSDKRPWWKLPMCLAGWCGFITGSDDTGIWGECATCGKRVGFVSREELRAYAGRFIPPHAGDEP